MTSWSDVLNSAALTPHGFCLSWEPGLMGLHVVSDALIAISYYSIPLALAMFALRRKDIAFGWMFWLFASFILACGTTHLAAIWTLWEPDYWQEGLIKAVTAAISVVCAIALWPLIPRALALPSPSALRRANQRLMTEIAERDRLVQALRVETAERLRAEEKLRDAERMETVRQLTGGVAHDFNNLLMSVQGNVEAIGRRISGDNTLERHLGRVLESVNRGALLTSQLLAFSRQLTLEPMVLDVSRLIGSLERRLSQTLGVNCHLELRGMDEPLYVNADPGQLETALMNLALNAAYAMPSGGTLAIATKAVAVEAKDADAGSGFMPGDYVVVTVTDTGLGMTEAVRVAAFEPFFTTRPVGEGTGLGLSQVYGFIKQSRGHVTLASTPGRGTVVTLYLRRLVVPAAATEAALSPSGAASAVMEKAGPIGPALPA